MKILLLSNLHSPHTIKWARALAERGLEIFIFSLSNYDGALYENYKNIQTFSVQLDSTITEDSATKISKLVYLKAVPKIKQMIAELKPDIVHAHYASSYGLLGALSRFHPYILSVWGADIFEFPQKSFLHRRLIKFNLEKADKILSTSHVMVKEIAKYTSKKIAVTPFGIDVAFFKPCPVQSLFDPDDVVIGTIKALDTQYGVEYLIKAFKILVEKYNHLPLKLLIVGGGVLEKNLKDLTHALHLEDRTIFTGRVSYDDVPKYHNMLSIFISLSVIDSESFGVAIIEASACEKPVVVADVGGMREVVEDGITGLIVPPKNSEKAAAAIEKLVVDEALRKRMGKVGRQRVKKMYDWNENVNQMIKIYNDVLKK
jgi:glycosyltransferase involved in cell wall biosynthesis